MSNQFRTKHHVFSIFIMMVVVFTLVFIKPNSVQAANDRTKVKNTIKSVVTAIKKADDKAVYKYCSSSDKQQMENIKKLRKQSAFKELKTTSPSAYQYIKANNKKVTYKINSIKIKKNKATLKVKVSYVNSYKLAAYMNAILTKDLEDDTIVEEINSLSSLQEITEYFTKYFDQLFSKALSKVKSTKMKSKTITLVLKKGKNGKWMITDENAKGFEALANILYADLYEATEKIDTSKMDYSKIDSEKMMKIIMQDMGWNPDDYMKYANMN